MIDFKSASYAREAFRRLPRIARAWPRALVTLLLACLLFQATAVQTHIHFTARAPAAASARDGPVIQPAKAGTGSDAADCPLCRQMAMAGAYLLPSATVLPSPPPFLWVAVAAIAGFDLLAPALGWLSRAPPR